MGIFATDDDERNAYRTDEDMLGRPIRRGTDKAIKCLTLGLLGGGDPFSCLGKDAANEMATKVLPRSAERDD